MANLTVNPADLTRLASTALAESAVLDEAAQGVVAAGRTAPDAFGGTAGAVPAGQALGWVTAAVDDTFGLFRQLLEDDADALVSAAAAYRRVQELSGEQADALAAVVADAPPVPRPGGGA